MADVLITLGLLTLVVRQVRPRTLDLWGLLWPVPLVLYLAYDKLHAVPSGSSLGFALLLASLGLLLGVLCGVSTQVYQRAGKVMAHATGIAVIFWILGISTRLAFGFAAEHGAGQAIARFSTAHHLALTAWIAGLLGMSLAEVLGRSGVLLWRWHQQKQTGVPALE